MRAIASSICRAKPPEWCDAIIECSHLSGSPRLVHACACPSEFYDVCWIWWSRGLCRVGRWWIGAYPRRRIRWRRAVVYRRRAHKSVPVRAPRRIAAETRNVDVPGTARPCEEGGGEGLVSILHRGSWYRWHGRRIGRIRLSVRRRWCGRESRSRCARSCCGRGFAATALATTDTRLARSAAARARLAALGALGIA